ALVLVVVRIWRVPSGLTGLATHALDIAFLALLAAQAEISLLLAFFTFFVLLAASLRWDWQSVLITAGIVTLVTLAGGTLQAIRSGNPGGDVAFVDALYVLVAGSMLAYSSAVRERRRTQLTKLTEWPGPEPSHTRRPNLGGLLAHCARALEASRVLVLW